MKDDYGRTIDYMRISLTDRCNMRCVYCMPASGVKKMAHEDILTYDEIARLVRIAAADGVHRIRLTGGEPLVRLHVDDLVRELAQIDGIDDISMTTNGMLLPRCGHALRQAGLTRVNISLDTLDPEKFHEVTRLGHLQDTLDGIQAALDEGFEPIKINAVAVRSLHQDYYQFARLSVDKPLHVRFIEYMPVGNSVGLGGAGWGLDDVISCEEIRQTINDRADELGMPRLVPAEKSPDGGGPARYWTFPGAQGTVGFISPLSNHFCGSCNRLRLSADGKIRPCLFSDVRFDVREALRYGSDEDVENVLRQTLNAKPLSHNENLQANATVTNMNEIGG